MIRVEIPSPLRSLARIEGELAVEIEGRATVGRVLDAIEAACPTLRGTMRDQVTRKRRPFVRFFASGRDLSLEPEDAPLPEEVLSGAEPFRVVGAIAGG